MYQFYQIFSYLLQLGIPHTRCFHHHYRQLFPQVDFFVVLHYPYDQFKRHVEGFEREEFLRERGFCLCLNLAALYQTPD